MKKVRTGGKQLYDTLRQALEQMGKRTQQSAELGTLPANVALQCFITWCLKVSMFSSIHDEGATVSFSCL